jgi:hypothetical protein
MRLWKDLGAFNKNIQLPPAASTIWATGACGQVRLATVVPPGGFEPSLGELAVTLNRDLNLALLRIADNTRSRLNCPDCAENQLGMVRHAVIVDMHSS